MKKIVFNFEEHKGKVIMHCKTFEEAKLWCEFMHDNGMRWNGGISYLEFHNWESNRENTCYSFNSNTYADLDFYIEQGYKIIEFSDIYVEEFTINDIEPGMLVKLRNGDICYVALDNIRQCMLITVEGRYVGNLDNQTNEVSELRKFDIIEIYDFPHGGYLFSTENRKLLWKREKRKITKKELRDILREDFELID